MINMDAKKQKYHKLYMDLAYRISQMSHCERYKVGCIIVKDTQIISMGWNGMPSGEDNCCEDKDGNTLNNVIHAEQNAIIKLAASSETSVKSVIYSTLAPCLSCAKLIVGAKISTVIYDTNYRTNDGLDYLNKHGIQTHQFNIQTAS